MSTPPISVLLPVRDAAPWLGEALASLRAQTYAEFEVLVQDDGSGDESPELAEEVARQDARFSVAREAPRGIAHALNAAAARARGDLFVRMDADDVCVPERLERLSAAATAHPEVDWFSSRVRYFPEEDVSEGMRRYERWVNGLLSQEDVLRDRFVECPLPHPTWAIRRETFESLGGYEDGPFPEDYELFLRAAEAGVRFLKLPDVLLNWREGPHRLCRNDPRYGLDRFLDVKLRYLVPRLQVIACPVSIVGAGAWGKRWGRRLVEAGVRVARYVDLHPGRVGQQIDGIPVDGYEESTRDRDSLFLVAVGNAEAREAARERLRAAGLRESMDFLCVQ